MHKYKTHNCAELNKSNKGETVKIAGWLHNYRDHGGIIFLDIRDHYGITQVVIPEEDHEMKVMAEKISKESTVSIEGKVELRPDDMINSNLASGEIEISATSIDVLSRVERRLPLEVNSDIVANEEARLTYRYLDLRREKVHNNIILRSKIINSIRSKMINLNFLEVNTPILTASSPEGARDYLVPSRVHHGKFYALPQAPQQFKQLLMISGFDKYFQIAPCFRDEDGRADRTPGEFYQLDLEMAFATQEDVLDVNEKVLYELFTEYSDKKIESEKFIRLTYKEALDNYGTDKPDLRIPLIIKEVTDIFANQELKAFRNSTVKTISVPKCSEQPRKFFDNMIDYATENGAGGLAWLKVEEGNKLNGPIAKFINEDGQKALIEATNSEVGAVLFFIADEKKKSEKLAGIVRAELGKRLELIDTESFKFCWIVDYPMFEYNDEEKLDFTHNPFSMPKGGYDDLINMNPTEILTDQYDLVCNGYELLSGAVRNHEPKTMVKAFEMAGYTEETVKSKFSALYEAFHFGAPPHAGSAFGIERVIMLLTGEENIREVIAFPMNNKAEDLLMKSPAVVSEAQLREIHIKIR